jgi:hypothetical protein
MGQGTQRGVTAKRVSRGGAVVNGKPHLLGTPQRRRKGRAFPQDNLISVRLLPHGAQVLGQPFFMRMNPRRAAVVERPNRTRSP